MGNPNVKFPTTEKHIWGSNVSAALAGPTGLASVFSYTVPDFRKAKVENLFLMIERFVASTSTTNPAYIQVFLNGYNDALSQNQVIYYIPLRSNQELASASFQLAQKINLYAGDVFAISRADVNNDGSVIFHWFVNILEEDA